MEKFKASLPHVVRPCLEKAKKNKTAGFFFLSLVILPTVFFPLGGLIGAFSCFPEICLYRNLSLIINHMKPFFSIMLFSEVFFEYEWVSLVSVTSKRSLRNAKYPKGFRTEVVNKSPQGLNQ